MAVQRGRGGSRRKKRSNPELRDSPKKEKETISSLFEVFSWDSFTTKGKEKRKEGNPPQSNGGGKGRDWLLSKESLLLLAA